MVWTPLSIGDNWYERAIHSFPIHILTSVVSKPQNIPEYISTLKNEYISCLSVLYLDSIFGVTDWSVMPFWYSFFTQFQAICDYVTVACDQPRFYCLETSYCLTKPSWKIRYWKTWNGRMEFFVISFQSTLINAIYELKQFRKHEKK